MAHRRQQMPLAFQGAGDFRGHGIESHGGIAHIVGSLFGVLIFSQIANLFTVNNLPTETQRIVHGAIIVGAVLVQQFQIGRFRRRTPVT